MDELPIVTQLRGEALKCCWPKQDCDVCNAVTEAADLISDMLETLQWLKANPLAHPKEREALLDAIIAKATSTPKGNL